MDKLEEVAKWLFNDELGGQEYPPNAIGSWEQLWYHNIG